MRCLWAHGFGRLFCDAEVICDERGKTFLLATIEFEERQLHNGKPYSQRIIFRSFNIEDIEAVSSLKEGTFVRFDGETDAVSEKSATGWWYANPRVTGRVLEICTNDTGVPR